MDSILNLEKVIWFIVIAMTVFIVPRYAAERIKRTVGLEYEELLETIKVSNARVLENEKQSREIRLKSALIAELFAEWTTQHDDRKKLRKLTFEAFLWLPEPLAVELSKILSHDDGAIGVREYIVQVRQFLLGNDDHLEHDKIITFGLTTTERLR